MPRFNSTGEHGALVNQHIDTLGGRAWKAGDEIPAAFLMEYVPLANRLALATGGAITFFDVPDSARMTEQAMAESIVELTEEVAALTRDKDNMKRAIVSLETQVNKLSAAPKAAPARRRAPAKKAAAKKGK